MVGFEVASNLTTSFVGGHKFTAEVRFRKECWSHRWRVYHQRDSVCPPFCDGAARSMTDLRIAWEQYTSPMRSMLNLLWRSTTEAFWRSVTCCYWATGDYQSLNKNKFISLFGGSRNFVPHDMSRS